jgi:AcrR family transcriptional regulator
MRYTRFMSIRENRRDAALDRMADHILSVGLAGATLRPLAAVAGTSDRMLLYYFADKDELLTAILERIAGRLLTDLTETVASRRPFAILLKDVWAVLNSVQHRPYMKIWYDLASGAARGLEPHRKVAGVIADAYLAWVEDRLEHGTDALPSQSAPLFLAAIQGMYLLDAIGRPVIASDAMIALGKTIVLATNDKLGQQAPHRELVVDGLTHIMVEHDADTGIVPGLTEAGATIAREAPQAPRGQPQSEDFY